MNPYMNPYKVIAVLLTYPDPEWLGDLTEVHKAVEVGPQAWPGAGALKPLVRYLQRWPLIHLQEAYVATFDLTPSRSLYLLEHTMGESPMRGRALADMIGKYRGYGFEMASSELPDFLPLFLEFLSVMPAADARRELVQVQDVLRIIRDRLARASSPYAGAFEALLALTNRRVAVGRVAPAEALRRFLKRQTLSSRRG